MSDEGISFPETFTIWQALVPLILLVLTRYGIPVSTTLLILSVFGTGVFITQVILKSIAGYFIAAILAFFIWKLISERLETHVKVKKKEEKKWVIVQWITTGYLWSVWLTHDVANIAVYLPRVVPIEYLIPFLIIGVAGIYYIFYKRGGQIQKIVTRKTNTEYLRSAAIIDFVYATILLVFSQISVIPISTTWVFVGLLAGRELAISAALHKNRRKSVYPIIINDFGKILLGLIISLGFAYGVNYLT